MSNGEIGQSESENISTTQFEKGYVETGNLERKQAEAIATLEQRELQHGDTEKAVRAGTASTLFDRIDHIFTEPTKKYIQGTKKLVGPAAKTFVGGLLSVLPQIGTITSDASLAAKGGEAVADTIENAAKSGKTVADVAKKALINLGTDQETLKEIAKIAKKLDTTPDIPAWLVTAANLAGKAGVPLVDVIPEAIQMQIHEGRFIKNNLEYKDELLNRAIYGQDRINTVSSRSEFDTQKRNKREQQRDIRKTLIIDEAANKAARTFPIVLPIATITGNLAKAGIAGEIIANRRLKKLESKKQQETSPEKRTNLEKQIQRTERTRNRLASTARIKV
jgi:hypothetical protein